MAACSNEPAKSPDNEPYMLTETPEPGPDKSVLAPDPGPAPVQPPPPANGINSIAPPPTGSGTSAASSPKPATGTDAAKAPPSTSNPSPDTAPGVAADNTKKNERDRQDAALTPIDQGNNETDLKITQKIRQAVMADGSLSFTAKNVKIITTGGKVTLRGPVKSDAERAAIETAAKNVAGAGQVDNQIEVKK